MERAELITHLEHLAEYVKYSEDAPALREAIALLKTHKERTETHACDLIERETARRIIDSPRTKEQMLRMLESMPPVQSDHIAEVSKKVDSDLISRQAAIDAVNAHYHDEYFNFYTVTEILKQLPPAQPDNRLSKIAELVEGTIDHFDLDDAMDLLYQIKEIVGNETSNIRG